MPRNGLAGDFDRATPGVPEAGINHGTSTDY
jgi:hypothetical protein